VTVARLAHALRRFWALGIAVVLGGGVLAGSAIANAPQSEPDLVPLLPTTTGHIAPIFVDTHTVPGKVLYRFSAVIKNVGGAMDLYKDPSTGAAMQVIWPGGDPTTMPDPNIKPTGKYLVEPPPSITQLSHMQKPTLSADRTAPPGSSSA